MTRMTKTKLNPKSMDLETVLILTCPRCGNEERLNDRRAKKTHGISIRVTTNGETRQEWNFDDVCLSCVSSLLEWTSGQAPLPSEQ